MFERQENKLATQENIIMIRRWNILKIQQVIAILHPFFLLLL